MQRRLEEAELAAAVQTRRAVSAEGDLALMKEQVRGLSTWPPSADSAPIRTNYSTLNTHDTSLGALCLRNLVAMPAPPSQLADAQRQVKELSWQIKVAFGGGGAATIGGKQGGPGGAGGAGGGGGGGAMGMLDILGCGANYRRN